MIVPNSFAKYFGSGVIVSRVLQKRLGSSCSSVYRSRLLSFIYLRLPSRPLALNAWPKGGRNTCVVTNPSRRPIILNYRFQPYALALCLLSIFLIFIIELIAFRWGTSKLKQLGLEHGMSMPASTVLPRSFLMLSPRCPRTRCRRPCSTWTRRQHCWRCQIFALHF